jgi:hypothetical protein
MIFNHVPAPSLMWSLTNTLQLLFYIGALNLYFTPELKKVFEYMKYSDFDNPITEYLSKLILSDVFTIKSPVSSQFEDMGFISTNFIGNMASKLPIIALMIWMGVLFCILYWCVKSKTNWFAKIVKKIDLTLRYEGITRFFVELSLNIQIVQWKWDKVQIEMRLVFSWWYHKGSTTPLLTWFWVVNSLFLAKKRGVLLQNQVSSGVVDPLWYHHENTSLISICTLSHFYCTPLYQ